MLASDPALTNRLLRLLGSKRVERIAQRNAIRAAQHAFEHVPYYRSLYEAHGFDTRRMKQLDWAGYLSLPPTSKAAVEDVSDEDLLDSQLAFPGDDALIGLSSGTTRKPVTWPVGWDEFYTFRAVFHNALRALAADRLPTAGVFIHGGEGLVPAGHNGPRAVFSAPHKRPLPFQ